MVKDRVVTKNLFLTDGISINRTTRCHFIKENLEGVNEYRKAKASTMNMIEMLMFIVYSI